MNLGHTLAPLNLLEFGSWSSEINVADQVEWRDVEIEVALDSGSVVHVCSLDDCRGYQLSESPGSRRGQEFQMGSHKIVICLSNMCFIVYFGRRIE